MLELPKTASPPPRHPRHRLYVDEYGHDGMTAFAEDNDRFLSIVGVACELEHIERTVKPELEKLKQQYFYSWNAANNDWRDPDEIPRVIVLHRSEMTVGKYPFGALRDTHIRDRFDHDFLSLLKTWEYILLAMDLAPLLI